MFGKLSQWRQMKRSLFVWCWLTVTARCDLSIKQNMIYMKTAPALKWNASDTSEGSLKTHTCPLTHAISICPAWMKSSQLTDIQWRGDTRVKWLHGKVTPNKIFCNTERCVEWACASRGLLVPWSEDTAGSWARASNSRGRRLLWGSFSVFFNSTSPSDGRSLLLEGRVPMGGRLHCGLDRVAVLLGSVKGQPPEERQLIGGQWLMQRFGFS